MKNKFSINPIHPILFGISPILFLYTHNLYDAQLSQLLNPLIIILTITIILIGSLRLLLKSNNKTGVIISLFYLIFFSYGSLFSLISKFDNGTDLDIIIFFVVLIFLGIGIYYILRSKSDLRVLTGFLNVFSITLISISLFNITVFALKRANDSEHVKVFETPTIRSDFDPEMLPNIYHLILDSYGREDVFNELYNYDNSDFTDFLKSKGFYVASKSVSNYSRTFLSVGSMLNLNYIDEVVPGIDLKSRDKSWWKFPIRNFLFFKIIKKFGYRIFALSSGYEPTELINADVYKNQGYIKDFDNLLFNTTLLVPVVARWYKFYDQYLPRRKKVLGAIEILNNLPEFSSPTYIYGHILSPHPPIVFDELGNPVDDPKSTAGREKYYEQYGNQVTFLNSEIKKIINGILTDPKRPTIIIVQGDHGLRSSLHWGKMDKKTQYKETLSILNAYYFHDRNYRQLYENISPVNSFRVIFSQYMGMDFELLEDKSYMSNQYTPYDFIEYDYKDSDSSSAEK